MIARLRRDDGFTIVEFLVVAALGLVTLTLLGTLLIGTHRTEHFTAGQTATIDDARLAMQQLVQEIRGADFINWCTPSGACLEVGARSPQGGFHTVRYARSGSELQRSVYDVGTASWSDPEVVINRVENPAGQPVFACDEQSTLLRVNIDLLITPTPESPPAYSIGTSVRPRNFPSTANCPTT